MLEENIRKENLFREISNLRDKLDLLDSNLNNGVLNVNKSINEILLSIRNLAKSKKDVNLSQEENRQFEYLYSEQKKKLKKLKSLHLEKYNEKIRIVNKRLKPILQKLLDNNLSDDVRIKIKSVPLLKQCDVLTVNKQLMEKSYLNTLQYDSITIAELMISQLENELNIKNDDLILGMNSIANEIDDVLKKMENHIQSEMNVEDVNKYLFECGILSGRLVELSVKHAKMRDKLDKVTVDKFNDIIVNLQTRIDTIKRELLEKKQEVLNESVYSSLKNELSLLEDDYTELVNKYFKDENKCTNFLVLEYRYFMEKYYDRLRIIGVKIEEYTKDNKVNQQQLENLNESYNLIFKIHDELDEKLDNEIVVLNNEEKKNNDFVKIEKGLENLRKAISNLGDNKTKDKAKKKEIQGMINELEDKFKGLDGLLLHQEKIESSEYEETKQKYDKYREELDKLRQSYEGKTFFVVKKVREASKVYKKHKKLSLVSAGLASMTLLTSGFALVPALMHGNAMLGSSVPAFKGMMSFFNKVLGSMIGASLGKNGSWVLATGVVLNSTVATTSILKFLATLGIGTAAFTAPLYIPQIVLKVKKLVAKIKEYDLKQKLSNTYQTGVKKVNEIKQNIGNKIDEYKLNKYYDTMYDAFVSYNNDGMSFKDFCSKFKLSKEDKEVLLKYITRGKLNSEINTAIKDGVKRGPARSS